MNVASFRSFQYAFYVNFIRRQFDLLLLVNKLKIKSCWCVLTMCQWVGAPVLFGWAVWYLLVVKPNFSPCLWLHCRVLFLIVWRVLTEVRQFVVDEFFLSFSLLPLKIQVCLFFFRLYFNYNPYFLGL